MAMMWFSLNPRSRLVLCSRKLVEGMEFIETPGLAPMSLRSGGFGFLDGLWKTWIALRSKYDVVHVTNGHRPANILSTTIARIFHGTITIDECFDLLGKGGHADGKKGII